MFSYSFLILSGIDLDFDCRSICCLLEDCGTLKSDNNDPNDSANRKRFLDAGMLGSSLLLLAYNGRLSGECAHVVCLISRCGGYPAVGFNAVVQLLTRKRRIMYMAEYIL